MKQGELCGRSVENSCSRHVLSRRVRIRSVGLAVDNDGAVLAGELGEGSEEVWLLKGDELCDRGAVVDDDLDERWQCRRTLA